MGSVVRDRVGAHGLISLMVGGGAMALRVGMRICLDERGLYVLHMVRSESGASDV